MTSNHNLRFAKIPLNFGTGTIPALGFGTLIPDLAETRSATTNALRVGFRHLDCAERYRNEREVGESLAAEFATHAIAREDVFITTKLWNTNHRPERVEPAFDASCARLGISYVDLYLIHTPFAFQPGDNYEPRDQKGNIIYDDGVTLLETWRAMEKLVDAGKCRAIGLSDVVLENLVPLYEAARIKPAVVQVESHPYLPQTELLEFCQAEGDCASGLCALGSWHTARPAGRSGSSGHRQANLADARAGAARVGHPTRNGRPDHGENSGAGARELQPLGDSRSGR